MAEIQLGVVEARYADIIWEHEPVSSSELVKLTEEAFHWKRTTAHNVLRRLCDKGLFRNDNGTVTSLISRDEFYAMQSRQFVEDTFEGSLPAFLAAFTKDRALTAEEAAKIRRMIDEAEGEKNEPHIFGCITDEYCRGMDDPCRNGAQTLAETGTEVGESCAVGACGTAAGVPFLCRRAGSV